MKNIYKYEDFLEKQIIEYIDYSINESVDINSMWNNVAKKVKNLSKVAKVRILKHLMATLLTLNVSSANLYNLINTSTVDDDTKKIAIEALSIQSKEKDNKDTIDPFVDKEQSSWKRGYEFSISENGINHIKDSEQLRLEPYSIGDGKITIGYGHAEPYSSSKYKIGDVITEKEAEDLLSKDLKVAEDGLKRIFHQWEKNGHDVMINQDMYDAMVSLAFNSGVGNLRKGQFLQDLKNGNFKEAGEKIKNFCVSKKFKGLVDRRKKESELFLKSV